MWFEEDQGIGTMAFRALSIANSWNSVTDRSHNVTNAKRGVNPVLMECRNASQQEAMRLAVLEIV